MQRGPDETGQIRPLRTYDGIHFTKFGARKLAHYVERDLRRVLREPIPAALNVPAEPRAGAAGQARGSGRAPACRTGDPARHAAERARRSSGRRAGGAGQGAAVAHARCGRHPHAGEGRADPHRSRPCRRLRPGRRACQISSPANHCRRPARRSPSCARSPRRCSRRRCLRAEAGRARAARRARRRSAGAAGQVRQQAQAPTFWRRQTQDSGPRFFFGLFGR